MAMSKPLEPYKCAFYLSNDILNRIVSIAYKLGQLSVTRDRPANNEDFALAAKATLAIEGIEIKPSQMRGLNKGDDVPSAPLATAIRDLYARMHRIDPRDINFLKEFEAAVFPEGVPYRLSRRLPNFPYPIPMHAKVEQLMKILYSFAEDDKRKVHPLALGCLFYFEIIAIAPYSIHNGILARYLLKAFLGSFSASLYTLPLERIMLNHQQDIRDAYDASVNAADTGPFVVHLLSLIEDGIDSLLRRSSKSEPVQSPLVKKLLEKMEEGRFYSATELCALLGLKSRLGLQKNYIKPGLEGKVLEMSNPRSPTDRTQRYRKK